MKKTYCALLAVATIAGSLVSGAPAAKAENGEIAAGVVGGLIGGALLGGAVAGRPAPVYGPRRVYEEEPRCRIVRERYFDDYSGTYVLGRPRQICD